MRTALTLMRTATRELNRNRKRTLLTVLGIVVGTLTLVMVLSLGDGLEKLALSQLGGLTPNNVYVEVKVPENVRAASELNALSIKTMDEADRQDIIGVPNISDASGWYSWSGKITLGGTSKTITVLGGHEGWPTVNAVPVEHGAWFSKADVTGAKRSLVLGQNLAQDLADESRVEKSALVGKNLKLGGKSFQVAAVAGEVDATRFFDYNDMAYVPMTTGQNQLWGDDHYLAIAAYMTDPSQVDVTTWRIANRLRQNRGHTEPEKDDFAVRTFDEAMGIVGTVTSGIQILLGAIAGISLLVGGVGIMNVMYTTVVERTKEIGLRKAIGARPSAIALQFVAEAVLVTFLGGLLGAVAGVALSWLAALGARVAGFDWVWSMPWMAIAVGIGSSVFIGLVFGIAPAKKAAQLDAIISLRQ